MSQHDFDIANQTASNARADINNALQALASLSAGASAPATTYANMLWYDSSNNILKMRSEADDAWINIGYVDQSTNAFRILDNTQIVNTSGTQTGLLGDQATSVWETGSATTESLVSPAKVKAAISSQVVEGGVTEIGVLTPADGSTSATLSSVDLSGYKFLHITVSGLKITDTAPLSLNGDFLYDGTGLAQNGTVLLDLSYGISSVLVSGNVATSLSTPSTTTSTTSLEFVVNVFSGVGQIIVYGIK